MLKRKAMFELEYWKTHKTKQALLVSGARRVGKTFLIRESAHEHYGTLAEVNFLENRDAANAVASASNAAELFVRLSIFLSEPLVPGIRWSSSMKCRNARRSSPQSSF